MNCKFNIAICDDDPNETKKLHGMLTDYSIHFCHDFTVSEFSCASDFLSQYDVQTFDILFLDVEMPEMSGIELATHVRNNGNDTIAIVFVSQHPEFMQYGFDVSAIHYLIKPIDESRLHNVLTRIITQHKTALDEIMIVNYDNTTSFIRTSTLLYIQTVKQHTNHLLFVFSDHTLPGLGTLSKFESLLVPKGFFMPNRGTLINLCHIDSIHWDTSMIIMKNNSEIPLSRRRTKQFMNCFNDHMTAISNSILNQ